MVLGMFYQLSYTPNLLVSFRVSNKVFLHPLEDSVRKPTVGQLEANGEVESMPGHL